MQSQPDAREDVYFVLTSLAHVTVTVAFGMLLNLPRFAYPGPLVIAFAVTSKSFALFAGENERFFTHLRWAAVPLAVASVAILAFLPPLFWILGGVVMLLYWNYPRSLRAREKSPFDVLFHGGRYSILFWMGYSGQVDLGAIVGASLVFLFGVAGELLVGLRSTANWKTTASRLGIQRTARLVNVLAFVLIVLGSLVFSTVIDFPLIVGGYGIPVPLLIGVCIALFITRPVSRHKNHVAPLSVRKREVLVLAVVGLIILGIPLGARVNLSQTTPVLNYRVNVVMQTIATGPHPWDVQWIVFDYRNSENYYYILLHTNGYLELSRYVNGTAETDLAYVQTGLSPFASNDYQITVDNATVQVSIDGHQYISLALAETGSEVLVSQSSPKTNYWFLYVSSFSVTPISS